MARGAVHETLWREPGEYVRVSGQIFAWPEQCACCSGPPDARVRVTYTRTTGTRIVRHTPKAWELPYCAACLAHAELARAAARVLKVGLLFALIVGFAVGLVVAGYNADAVGQVGTEAEAAAIPVGSVLDPTTVGAGAAVVIAAATFLVWNWFRSRGRARMHSECPTMDYAVAYEGWAGSVHTFRFRNPDYARALTRTNARKVLW